MTRSQAEIVRGAMDAIKRGDARAMDGLAHVDYEFQNMSALPNAGVSRGLEAAMSFSREFDDTWETFVIEEQQVRDRVILGRVRAMGKATRGARDTGRLCAHAARGQAGAHAGVLRSRGCDRGRRSRRRGLGNTEAMSQANLELVRKSMARFQATHEFVEDGVAPDFVWDMSKFRNWPERQIYEGPEGARSFLEDWIDAWEDWEIETEALHDADDKVVAVMRQHGRSKASGLPVDMSFAQVWTVGDGRLTRMEMYADPAEAIAAVGLSR
jgi:ketosteroid isomerase-like protein